MLEFSGLCLIIKIDGSLYVCLRVRCERLASPKCAGFVFWFVVSNVFQRGIGGSFGDRKLLFLLVGVF